LQGEDERVSYLRMRRIPYPSDEDGLYLQGEDERVSYLSMEESHTRQMRMAYTCQVRMRGSPYLRMRGSCLLLQVAASTFT
jgi:hypothetical protein